MSEVILIKRNNLLGTKAVGWESDDENDGGGEEGQLNPVDPVEKVLQDSQRYHLIEFQEETNTAGYDDNDSHKIEKSFFTFT